MLIYKTVFTNMRYQELFLSIRVYLFKNEKVSNQLELWKVFPLELINNSDILEESMKLKLLSSRIPWNYESIQFCSDSIISYDSSVCAMTGET